MVQARLEALDAEARRVLRAASVFGQVFWRGGVDGAARRRRTAPTQSTEWLGRARRARGGRARARDRRFPGEEEYVFRHALVREAAYAMLTEADRALGHRLAGEWLERAGERDADGARRALRARRRAPARAAAGTGAPPSRRSRATTSPRRCTAPSAASRCGAARRDARRAPLVQAEAHSWRGEFARRRASAAHDAAARLPPRSARVVRRRAVGEAASGRRAPATATWRCRELIEVLQRTPPLRRSARACPAPGERGVMYAGPPRSTDKLLERALAEIGGVSPSPDPARGRRLDFARGHLRATTRATSGGFLSPAAASAAGRARRRLPLACHDGAAYAAPPLELGASTQARAPCTRRARRRSPGGSTSWRMRKHNLGLALALRGRSTRRGAPREAATVARAERAHDHGGASPYAAADLGCPRGDSPSRPSRGARASALASRSTPAPTPADGARRPRHPVGSAPRPAAAAGGAGVPARSAASTGGELPHCRPRRCRKRCDAAGQRRRGRRPSAPARADRRAPRQHDNPTLRESFLQRVPENARVMELAQAWL